MGRPRKNASTSAGHPAKKIQSLEGLSDIVSETDLLWETVLRRLQKMSRIYGFNRVETPLLEDAQLYQSLYSRSRGFVESLLPLDILGTQVALRPTLLPSVLRAYVQHKVFDSVPLSKWAYSGFTVKQHPGGGLKGDFEFGFEVFGSFNHLTEAQVIGVVWEMLATLGLQDVVLEINNIGTPACQAVYEDTLHGFLSGKKYQLCDYCNDHLQGRILNVFRCNNLDCQAILSEAPTILDFLDQQSHKHFTSILEALDELAIPYQLNPLYVGPEGHGKTNFVIKHKQKGETKIIGEGGYHEGLMENLCGKNYCCFGFCGSLNAIEKLLEESKITVSHEQKNDVFLVPLGEMASKKSLKLFRDLTTQRISVYDHFGNLGVKNQLKQAETFKAPIALIIGQKEAMDEMVILRDVKSGMQELISYDKIVEEVKKRLGR